MELQLQTTRSNSSHFPPLLSNTVNGAMIMSLSAYCTIWRGSEIWEWEIVNEMPDSIFLAKPFYDYTPSQRCAQKPFKIFQERIWIRFVTLPLATQEYRQVHLQYSL